MSLLVFWTLDKLLLTFIYLSSMIFAFFRAGGVSGATGAPLPSVCLTCPPLLLIKVKRSSVNILALNFEILE